jgi:chromosome segregation ATPase
MTDKTTDGAASHPTNRAAGYMLKFLAALIAGMMFSFPAMATLYKWVDSSGVTHYGETIPPEYADRDHEVLNKAGRVIQTEEVMTPERRRAKELEDAKKREQAESALEQQRYDRTLLNTYSNVDEIDQARIRNLQQIDARINAINAFIKSANDNLASLQAEAATYDKANRTKPASLEQDLQVAEQRLTQLHHDLQAPQDEKAALQKRFDADKARYIELTGKK